VTTAGVTGTAPAGVKGSAPAPRTTAPSASTTAGSMRATSQPSPRHRVVSGQPAAPTSTASSQPPARLRSNRRSSARLHHSVYNTSAGNHRRVSSAAGGSTRGGRSRRSATPLPRHHSLGTPPVVATPDPHVASGPAKASLVASASPGPVRWFPFWLPLVFAALFVLIAASVHRVAPAATRVSLRVTRLTGLRR
jgi:hypothetical protein